jgi:plasmid stabilization system protein ParE
VQVVWSDEASDDLALIHGQLADYSGLDSAAGRIRKILASAALLRVNAELGRVSKLAGVRELIVPNTPNIIGYRIEDSFVQIIGVRNGRQDFPSGGSWNV